MPAPTARRAMGPQRRALLCAFVALLLVYAGYAVWRASAWRGGRRPVKNTRGEQAQAPSVPPVQVPDDRGSGLPAHGESLAPVPTLPHTTKAPTDAPRPLALEPAVKKADNFVAVCAATRSRSAWTTLAASDPVRILLPSLARTTTAADNVRVFLGANADDAFWGRERAQELARHARTAWALDVALRQYAHAPNHIPFNALMRDAFDAGAEFLVRVNDDTEFVTPGWVRLGVDALAAFEPPNVGVVGPVCREGKTDILTHDMVHRTHLTIFHTYYPPEFSNWFVDDWISRVYGAARTRRHEGWVVKHRLTPTRYRPEERERAQLERLVGAGVQRVAEKLAKTQDSAVKYAIFTACDSSLCEMYQRNINTLRCYAKRHADYELAIFSEKDIHLQAGCTAKLMKFRRHCMLANFLQSRQDIAAVLFLDSDSAVLDFNKRFEQFAVKNLNFEIRFHNGEIACSPTIAKNTAYTRQFFKEWGAMHNFPLNEDNGALHQLILMRLGKKDECVKQSRNYDEFRRCFVRVVHEQNCGHDFWHYHATVAFPLQTFSYDGWLTKYRYSDRTFIHHAMKNPPIAGNYEGRLMPDIWNLSCQLNRQKDPYYISAIEENSILESKLSKSSNNQWLQHGMTLSSCMNRKNSQDLKVETKIFNVGLPKSGSTSLNKFFECGGLYTSHHICQHNFCGKCIFDNVKNGRDPIHNCGNYNAFMQMDLSFVPPNDDLCIFPQISAISHLHTYYPHSIFVLPVRNAVKWAHSVMNWNDLSDRLQRCFKWKQGRIEDNLIDFYNTHTNKTIEFAKKYHHKLILFDLEDYKTPLLLEREFNISRMCWGHLNEGKKNKKQVRIHKNSSVTPKYAVDTHSHRFTVVVSVSQGFDDMFRNWLYWFQKANVTARLVVYAEDGETFRKYENCTCFTLRSASNESAGKAFAYNTAGYNALVSRRPNILLQCLYEFGDVLYSDIDVVWKQSPMSWLVNDYDVWAQDDKTSDNLCTGFIALRNTPKVIAMLKQWSKQQQKTISINQENFNRLVMSMKLKVYHLPMSLFVSGYFYFDNKTIVNESSLVTIHNNFIIGKLAKTIRFQKHGLWRPLPEHFCKHSHSGAHGIKMQQSSEQRAVTVNEIRRLQLLNVRCNLLIFGIGYDAIFWHEQNKFGRTVFLEHDIKWLQKIKKLWPELEVYHVQYHTLIRRDLVKYENSSAWYQLSLILPDSVSEEIWHIIVVDGPTGYNQDTIGRFQSLYMSITLRCFANALIVVDDCERELEKKYSAIMLGIENKFLEIERPSTTYAAANKQCYFRRFVHFNLSHENK